MCKDKKFPSFLDSYYWIPQDDSLFTGLEEEEDGGVDRGMTRASEPARH